MVKVELKDGSKLEVELGMSILDIAKKISEGLARNAMAGKVDGEVKDLRYPIEKDCKLEILTFDDEDGKKAYWHTTAHIMAQAVKRLYGESVKLTIGPSIENGFYYDVDSGEATIKDSDLPVIEAKMAELAAKKETLVRESIAKEDALKKFGERGETYKCELISELEDGHITTYTQGAFTDLCRGPHLVSTAPIKAIKLLSVAGAYWRGQEDRKQMTRP